LDEFDVEQARVYELVKPQVPGCGACKERRSKSSCTVGKLRVSTI
jgi:hypothetical protein